jgi:VIT1/CCC1 family predicted Fe2+/Mn2+ transporter
LDFFLSGEIFLFLSFFITFFPLFLLDVSISRIFKKNIYDKIWWKNKKKT